VASKVKYYGTRGSLPVAGKGYDKYGGNTTCLYLNIEGEHIIVDAGTGIKTLANDLMKQEFSSKEGGQAHLLFTHTHWDHIQGFPFFVPALLPANKINIYGETKRVKYMDIKGNNLDELWTIEHALYMQQVFMFFPIETKYMAANLNFHEIKEGKKIKLKSCEIEMCNVQHPNNTLAFRFNFEKESFVFCTDVEHNDEMIKKLITFSKDATVLAYDCQYTPEEYATRVTWGHSTFEIGAKIAQAANVKELHMIHHDPAHNDEFLDKLELRAQKLFKNTHMVFEGKEFKIE